MEKEMQKVTIHIKYKNDMTVHKLEDSIHILNEAFNMFYKEHYGALCEDKEFSPNVVSVSNGSFIIDVIVPVTCALLPILYDIIKNKYASHEEYDVDVCKTYTRMLWLDADCYELSKAVLEEYAVKKSKKSVDEFIDTISLSRPYKRESVRMKVQNTKQLLTEQKIDNTVPVTPLKNYSKAHSVQFNKACKALNL